jgi:hypothetical protein
VATASGTYVFRRAASHRAVVDRAARVSGRAARVTVRAGHMTGAAVAIVGRILNQKTEILFKKLPLYTLAGFDLTIHSSCLLGGAPVS